MVTVAAVTPACCPRLSEPQAVLGDVREAYLREGFGFSATDLGLGRSRLEAWRFSEFTEQRRTTTVAQRHRVDVSQALPRGTREAW